MSDPWGIRKPKLEAFRAINVDEAVINIAAYLERNTSEHNQLIYFDGWGGLGASAVLKSLAKHPPPSLRNKFDTILHIDCSKWKNRRTLQRTIAQELKLPQHVIVILDRRDEDDDFARVDEGSQGEIRQVGRMIHQPMVGRASLVVFHNGSNRIIDLNDFGIPRQAFDPWSSAVGGKVLWTFRGRFRHFPFGFQQKRGEESYLDFDIRIQDIGSKVEASSTVLLSYFPDEFKSEYWYEILEATEIALYTTNKLSVTPDPDLAAICCWYLFSVNSSYCHTMEFKRSGDTEYFNWATHASNYWVCDGIIQDSQQDKAWDIAAALQEEMPFLRELEETLMKEEIYDNRGVDRVEFPYFVGAHGWWTVAAGNLFNKGVYAYTEPEATSLFLFQGALSDGALSDSLFLGYRQQLHVLKLCDCIFRFSSPPFLHCKTLRFLGLDSCKDQPENFEETREKGEQIIEFFQSLSVLDICRTNWELTSPPGITKEKETNIREINIQEGSIWHEERGWIWRNLRNIHKLRVIAPTRPWKTESMDDLADLDKLELLDLTGNSTMQVLPSLSGATALSTLVLDGCVGLEHVGPESLPPSLETFSFNENGGDYSDERAKISRISMAACARLVC